MLRSSGETVPLDGVGTGLLGTEWPAGDESADRTFLAVLLVYRLAGFRGLSEESRDGCCERGRSGMVRQACLVEHPAGGVAWGFPTLNWIEGSVALFFIPDGVNVLWHGTV